MAALRFFYTDYVEDKSIPSDQARAASKVKILHSMDCVLHRPGNFLGIIDENDVTLQFYVNDDLSIHIDIPSPERGGSLVKTASLGECLELVRNLADTIPHESIPRLTFETW